MRFHLVDSITAWHPGDRATGYKAVTRTDDLMQGRETLPRTLLIEAFAQLGSFLLGEAEARDGRKVLSLMTTVDRLGWESDVHPGERATLDVSILSRRPEGAKLSVAARVGDRPVARGHLSYVFFPATSDVQAREFAWTYELLLDLTSRGCAGDPPRREVFA